MKKMMRRIVRFLKTKLTYYKNIIAVERKNDGIVIGCGVTFQNPQYITFGENVVLGWDSSLRCIDTYNGRRLSPDPQLSIGDRFHCTRNFVVQCASKVVIGNDVLVASDVFVIDFNHGLNPLTDNYLENDLSLSEGVFIDDGVWIGNDVVILGGVHIGKKSVIGAGSVVTKDIPPYSIAVGNPARVIKKYDFVKNAWEPFRQEPMSTAKRI